MINLSRKPSKNKKLLHQVIKSETQNSCYKHNKPLTCLECTENRNTFKHFLKTDSELAVDDDQVLKSNWIVIPGDL